MKDLIPPEVRRLLRDRYIAGTADAIAQFASNQADEDSLTGALGQAISMEPINYRTTTGEFNVRIYYSKLRGRGHNAPEKRYGPDGVFQIDVRDMDDRILRRKGLPFQAKKNWQGRDNQLVKQAGDMIREIGGGIVVDFSPDGYKTCSAAAVIQAGGNRTQVQNLSPMRDLGQILANDFLDCTMGTKGLYYDPQEEIFEGISDRNTHTITTEIIRDTSS
jgi:hypothetical protein